MVHVRRPVRLLLVVLAGALVLLGVLLPATATAAQEPPAGGAPEIRVNVVDRQGTAERDDDEPVEGAVIVVTDAQHRP